MWERLGHGVLTARAVPHFRYTPTRDWGWPTEVYYVPEPCIGVGVGTLTPPNRITRVVAYVLSSHAHISLSFGDAHCFISRPVSLRHFSRTAPVETQKGCSQFQVSVLSESVPPYMVNLRITSSLWQQPLWSILPISSGLCSRAVGYADRSAGSLFKYGENMASQ